jgi:hypothetical protein
MPNLRRSQVYEILTRGLVADGEVLFADALARSGMKDRPLFKPEEVARLGQALMEIAREQAATPTH